MPVSGLALRIFAAQRQPCSNFEKLGQPARLRPHSHSSANHQTRRWQMRRDWFAEGFSFGGGQTISAACPGDCARHGVGAAGSQTMHPRGVDSSSRVQPRMRGSHRGCGAPERVRRHFSRNPFRGVGNDRVGAPTLPGTQGHVDCLSHPRRLRDGCHSSQAPPALWRRAPDFGNASETEPATRRPARPSLVVGIRRTHSNDETDCPATHL